MYLMLSVAGHLTVFWRVRAARSGQSASSDSPLAVLGTQTLATLIAVYGVFMTPLGWGWQCSCGLRAGVVLATDRMKLLAYRILDPPKLATRPMRRLTWPRESVSAHGGRRRGSRSPSGGWYRRCSLGAMWHVLLCITSSSAR